MATIVTRRFIIRGPGPRVPENLYESEGAYLTWLYCLMAQPEPKDADFVNIGAERFMPAGLNDRKIHLWLGDGELCRKLLRRACGGELAVSAAARRCCSGPTTRRRRGTVPRSASRCSRVRSGSGSCADAETHERQYHRAYNAFVKGRAQSDKTGRLPGIPIPPFTAWWTRRPTLTPEPGRSRTWSTRRTRSGSRRPKRWRRGRRTASARRSSGATPSGPGCWRRGRSRGRSSRPSPKPRFRRKSRRRPWPRMSRRNSRSARERSRRARVNGRPAVGRLRPRSAPSARSLFSEIVGLFYGSL